MRILSTVIAMAALCAPAIVAQSAPATPPAALSTMPACAGLVAVVRVSEITPDGSMEKFMAAVAAQKAWYDSRGLSDQIFASKILVRDPDTKAYSYSSKEVLSYHFYSATPNTPEPKHDAAWDAFVKLFKDSSTIKESTLTCIPADMVPMKM